MWIHSVYFWSWSWSGPGPGVQPQDLFPRPRPWFLFLCSPGFSHFWDDQDCPRPGSEPEPQPGPAVIPSHHGRQLPAPPSHPPLRKRENGSMQQKTNERGEEDGNAHRCEPRRSPTSSWTSRQLGDVFIYLFISVQMCHYRNTSQWRVKSLCLRFSKRKESPGSRTAVSVTAFPDLKTMFLK